MSTAQPSWRLKVARARDHLKEIEDKIAAYGDTHSYRAARARPRRREQHIWRYTLEITADPDPMLAVVIGDVVHNARSALDHIAVALVPANRRRHASFPICLNDPGAVNAAGNPKDPEALARFQSAIQGAPPDAVAVIESAQPYKQPDPFFDTLGVLSRLDNADKHRELIAVATGLRDTQATISRNGKVFLTQDGPGLRDDGAEVARFIPKGTPPPESEVQVEVSGTPLVAMKVGSDEDARKATGVVGVFRLPDALDQILIEVSEVLDALEPLLP